MEDMTVEELLESIKEKVETSDIAYIAKVARQNNCAISIEWDADGVELWIKPND